MAYEISLAIDGMTDQPQYGGPHPDGAEILSWNHGVSQHSSVKNLLRDELQPEANHQDLCLTRYSDHLTPALYLHCSTGTIFPSATMAVRLENGDQLLFRLSDVTVSGCSVSGAEGGLPTESLSLNYRHVVWEYRASPKEGKTEVFSAEWSTDAQES